MQASKAVMFLFFAQKMLRASTLNVLLAISFSHSMLPL